METTNNTTAIATTAFVNNAISSNNLSTLTNISTNSISFVNSNVQASKFISKKIIGINISNNTQLLSGPYFFDYPFTSPPCITGSIVDGDIDVNVIDVVWKFNDVITN
jgi:hypothetical protein